MSIDLASEQSASQINPLHRLLFERVTNMSAEKVHPNYLQASPNLTFATNEFVDSEMGGDLPPTFNLTINEIRALIKNYKSEFDARNTVIIIFYMSIVLVSLFGNLFVCYVILKRKRMRTSTNLLMANLAVSDLLMTVINIPFNLARILLNEWPFGSLLCIMVPLVQVTSVYVSTFTMTVIAIDRYQAIINPLHKRLSTSVPTSVSICFIWLAAALFAIPNVAFNRVAVIITIDLTNLHRCRAVYPTSSLTYRRYITLFTFLTQYAIPLSITTFAYIRISFYIWHKLTDPTESCSSASNLSNEKQLAHNGTGHEYVEQSLPSVGNSQLGSFKRTCYYQASVMQLRERSRRKSIKMLALVVAVFAICWMPLNIFHLETDFSSSNQMIDSNTFFICHWIAMSSVCYNPFIYFWLNRHYRQEIKQLVQCANWFCFRTEQLKTSHEVIEDPYKRKPWLKNRSVCQSNGEFPDDNDYNNDNNNNKKKANVDCHLHQADQMPSARVRYDSNKPAKCKITFRSRYNNVPRRMSSSSSGQSNSSQKKNKSKLHRSNAVRVLSNSQSIDASSNRSNINMYNSMPSSRSDSYRGSDI